MAIRALARRPQAPRKGVEWVTGDLQDKASLAALAAGTQAVLHIAGVVKAPDISGFESGNIAGTHNVVQAARGSGIGRFVCVSSLAAREPGLSDYGHSKRMAEEIVQVSGLDWTIVRPPAIYGPRDTEMLDLFRTARRGVVPMPPHGRASVLHVADLARLLLDLVCAGPEVSQRMFEPDDGQAGGWTHDELATMIGAAVGRRVWSPAIPAVIMRCVARIDRLLRGSSAKLTPDRVRYMLHPDWVSGADRDVPGHLWRPAIATPEGLAQTARWYRSHSWLG